MLLLVTLSLAAAGGVIVFFAHRARVGAGASNAPTSAPSPSTATAPTGPLVVFVVPPTVTPEVIRRELAPFLTWLGRAVDHPIELAIADSYDNAAELVKSGRAQIGLFPPLLVVRALALDPRVEPFAVRLYDGSRGSDADGSRGQFVELVKRARVLSGA